MKKSLLPFLVVVCALAGTIRASTTTYDGTYSGNYSGNEVCTLPDGTILNTSDPITQFTFTLLNGQAQSPYAGGVDAFGNLIMTLGPLTFTGTITFTGVVNNGKWTQSGLATGCNNGGTWSATLQAGTGAGTGTIGAGAAGASQPFPWAGDPASGGPVDLATLAETFSHTLLTLSGARTLEFTISYNSQLTAGNQYVTPTGGTPYWTLYTPGDVGHWTHNFEGQAKAVTINNVNEVVLLVAHRRWTFLQNGSSYQTSDQAAAYDSLVQNADGSYTLTTKDQSTYTFSGPGLYLTQVTNPHGQAITIDRNALGQINKATEPVSNKSLSFIYGTTGNSTGRITKITDSTGRSVSLAYDSNFMLSPITEANGGLTSFTYDSGRHLLTVADAQNNILTTNTYDPAFGYVTTQKDARGNQYSYSYSPGVDANGTFVTYVYVTDRNGFSSTYVFDQNHNLRSYTSNLGYQTSYTYGGNGNLLSKTDPLFHKTSYAYTNGDVTQITDAMGKITGMTYDGRHNLKTVMNPDNDTSRFDYDAQNNLLTATDSLGHQVGRTYYPNSLLHTQTNPLGGLTTYSYDTNGLLSMRTDAASNTETMTHDPVGNLHTLTDPTGATTTYFYGTLRELTEIDDAMGNKVVNTYDWRLRKSTVTDPSLAVTQYHYDGNNNIDYTINALSQKTTFVYDNEDRPIQVTDPLNHTSYRYYDADGRLFKTADAVGDTTSYTYDGANNLRTVADGFNTTVVTNTYTARNQLFTSTDALGRTSTLTYDDARFLASTKDPLGAITSFVPDALGRTKTVNAPLSTVTSQSFDADGNRTPIVNGNNKSTNFTFDIADRLSQITTATGKATAYAYNTRSLTSSLTLSSGSATSLTYDALGRLSMAVDPIGTITYSYDNNGRVKSTAQTSSGTIGRQYDLLGRLTQFTDAAGNVLKYTYDNAGNLKTLTYPDLKLVTYGYDAARRLTKVTDWAGRVTSYAYDVDSRVAKITRPDQSVETFTYDAAGQITQSNDVAPVSPNLLHTIHYTFDGDSEITAEDISPAPAIYHPAALTLPVDADNRLATINTKAAGYDNNGNLTSATIPGSAISALTYDQRNRLHTAGGLTYAYDAENRRTSVTSFAGVTNYVINPNAGLDQVLVKTAPNGAVTRYVYGLGLIGEETNSIFTTYHYDHRGSTTALTDINGNVIQSFSYGPNGEPVDFDPATAPKQFLYGGRYGVFTDANGLCNMRARYYLPAISRFINQDILLGNIAPGISLNRFAYANGDPIDKNDPFGLAADPLVPNGDPIGKNDPLGLSSQPLVSGSQPGSGSQPDSWIDVRRKAMEDQALGNSDWLYGRPAPGFLGKGNNPSRGYESGYVDPSTGSAKDWENLLVGTSLHPLLVPINYAIEESLWGMIALGQAAYYDLSAVRSYANSDTQQAQIQLDNALYYHQTADRRLVGALTLSTNYLPGRVAIVNAMNRLGPTATPSLGYSFVRDALDPSF